MPDFAYLDVEATEVKDKNPMSNVGSSQGGQLAARPKARFGDANYKAGTINQASAALMIPPAIQGKLTHISQVYGLPFDIGAMSLQIATPENLNSFRTIVDMFSRNSKLLPEILQLVKKLMKADIRLAEYHAGVTKAALKHGEAIDQATAEIFTMMSKAAVKSAKLEHKTNRRHELRTQRHSAWEGVYEDTIVSGEMKAIQSEFETMGNNALLRRQNKEHKVKFNAEREAGDINHDTESHQHGTDSTTATKDKPKNGGNGNKAPKK